MNYYRSNMKGGGGGSEYDATYTASIGNELLQSSADEFFINNTSFNDECIIGNNICRCYSMFQGCTSYNKDTTIPKSVLEMANMFSGCTKFGKNVYVKGSEYRALNVGNMFNECNNSLRKNIYFHSSLNNIFNATGSVVSGIAWTAMTNGFYNAAYNVYCYYNYSG